MKRLAAALICLCLFSYCPITANAEETPSADGAVISVTVPESHTLTVEAPDNVEVLVNGNKGAVFNVERLSEPTLEIKAHDDEEIVKVTLNSEDITDKLVNGQYKLPPVYENLALEVETKAVGTAPTEPTTPTTEPTTSTTEPTTSRTTDSTTSSTATSESSSNTNSDSSKTNSSSSKPDSSSSKPDSSLSKTDSSASSTTTTTSSNGGTSNSNTNNTYPNNSSPNTGDFITVNFGTSALFLGVAVLMVLLKKRNKDEE